MKQLAYRLPDMSGLAECLDKLAAECPPDYSAIIAAWMT